jgi:tetratricopeptide (TPR) repeat protein
MVTLVLQKMKHFLYLFFVIYLSFLVACNTPDKPLNNLPDATPDSLLQPYYQQIQLFPDSVPLYEILIDTLANQGRYADAARWCDSVMLREKEQAFVWQLVKGDLFRMGKLYDSAVNAYHKYLQVFPDDEQVLLNLANTLADKGDSSTLVLCKRIDVMFPNAETRSGTAYIVGLYYNMKGDYGTARRWLDSAISLKYAFKEAWFERGYGFYDEKKYKEAQANFKQLTQIHSSDADAWYWMGKCAEALEQKDQALTYYSRAYSLNRDITEARRAMERLKKKG